LFCIAHDSTGILRVNINRYKQLPGNQLTLSSLIIKIRTLSETISLVYKEKVTAIYRVNIQNNRIVFLILNFGILFLISFTGESPALNEVGDTTGFYYSGIVDNRESSSPAELGVDPDLLENAANFAKQNVINMSTDLRASLSSRNKGQGNELVGSFKSLDP